MEFTDVLRLRRSTRAYTPEQITPEQLDALLDAAETAPVGMGQFDRLALVVVQDRELLDNLDADFAAAVGDESQHPTYGAPTVIFVLQRKEDPDLLSGANAACVVEHMALAATDLGLGSVYLLGLCRELQKSAYAHALLRIPSTHRMVSALAVGHPAQPLEAREISRRIAVRKL